MALGIKIIRCDGREIAWWQAPLRYLGYIVSLALAGLGFIWIAFDSRKQGLHDKIADTCVVKVPKPPKTKAVVPQVNVSGCA